MKHLVRVLVALGIVVAPAAAFAQIATGVRVGANLATLSTDPNPPLDLHRLPGIVAGGFVTLPINGLFAIQPEALYSRQGTAIKDSGVTARTKIDYVQIPVLARVRTGTTSPLAVFAGPTFGIRTHATFSAPGVPADVSANLDDELRRSDVGVTTGAVFEVGHVVLDGRYTWGLTNIAKKNPNPNDQDTVRNRVLALSAGFRF